MGRPGDRVARATAFLAAHRTVVVDPRTLVRAELQHYPISLEVLPLELDLGDLPAAQRARALELLLRRDDIYVSQGKDIRQWARGYKQLKGDWLATVERIIQDAISAGTLSVDQNGSFRDLRSSKEDFLVALDRRHFGSLSTEEREALGSELMPLFLGATKDLPAIRLTSLCFWYGYVDVEKTDMLRRSGSDIGDFLQLCFAPYCLFFTLDTTMWRLMRRVEVDQPARSVFLRSKDLDERLAAFG
jgi:hypothetical protein